MNPLLRNIPPTPTYRNCPIHQQPLNLVCISPTCPNPTLICSQCHPNHQTLPVQKFSQIVNQRRSDQQVSNAASAVLKTITEKETEAKKLIARARQRIFRELKKLEEKIVGELEEERRAVQEVAKGFGIGGRMGSYSAVRLEVEMGRYENALKIFQAKKNIMDYLFSIPPKLRDSLHPQLTTLLQLPPPYLPNLRKLTNSPPWHFSPTLKHKSLNTNKSLLYRIQPSIQAVGALINERLEKGSMWSVLVRKLEGEVWLGVALEREADRQGYLLGSWREESGLGLVSTSGRVMAGDGRIRQCQMRVKEGDTVLMGYEADRLIFVNGEESYEIDIELAPEYDCYRPCVYLYKPTDIVEILHNT